MIGAFEDQARSAGDLSQMFEDIGFVELIRAADDEKRGWVDLLDA